MQDKLETKEKEKLFKKICRKVGVTIRNHELLAQGDHILVGLSGGKDSLIMLEVLAERRQVLPFDFNITAAHIELADMQYEVDLQSMENLCKEVNVPLIVRNGTINPESKKKGICYACSWQRRKIIFDLSKELRCNKIALGHHRHDAVETLLINMIYHGSISSLPYRLSMFDGRIHLIRPLLEMDEHLLADYAKRRNYGIVLQTCPFETENKRIEIRKIIDQIELLHGKGIYNIFSSSNKIFEEYLPKKVRTP